MFLGQISPSLSLSLLPLSQNNVFLSTFCFVSVSLAVLLAVGHKYLSGNFPLTSTTIFRSQGDIEKAITQLKATIQWREEFGVLDLIHCLDGGGQGGNTNKGSSLNDERPSREELAKIIRLENETGKMYARGHDKEGRTLLYMRPAMENTNVELDNMRHLVYNLEKAISCSTSNEGNKDGKICLIIDYEGFQMRHAPSMSTSRKTLNILQHHYPERMYRVYLCNPPLLFRTVWAMVKPFVDPVTKEKVCFCHGEKGLAKIQQDMEGYHHYLEPCAGGSIGNPIRKFQSIEYLSLPFHVSFDEKQE